MFCEDSGAHTCGLAGSNMHSCAVVTACTAGRQRVHVACAAGWHKQLMASLLACVWHAHVFLTWETWNSQGGANDKLPPISNKLAGGWEKAGPIALFDGAAEATLVVSPYSGLTTTQSIQVGEVLSFGPRGSIKSLPPGFVAGTVVMLGQGIARTMRQWGLALMAKSGKDPNSWKEDYSMKYLGYTTVCAHG